MVWSIDSCESLLRSVHSDMNHSHVTFARQVLLAASMNEECDVRCCLQVLWGYRTFTPQDYCGYFLDTGVTDVVRLNNKVDPFFTSRLPIPKLVYILCLTFSSANLFPSSLRQLSVRAFSETKPNSASRIVHQSFTRQNLHVLRWHICKSHPVGALQLYEGSAFEAGGFNHHDLYFPDGSCPSNSIVLRFLDICENSKGAVAVHCKVTLMPHHPAPSIVPSACAQQICFVGIFSLQFQI